MKIAQVSPLMESVPPKLYGGTERIVSYLTEELVRQGHEVTLFASGDSETAAKLVACAPQALRLAQVNDTLPHHVQQLEKVRRSAFEFDVLHFHTDYLHFPLVPSLGAPVVTTMHGRLDWPSCRPLFAEFPDIALVSVSDDQRKPLPARWIATVPHGLPKDLYSFSPEGGAYLAFLGRISPEKRPDRAIEIARRAGVKLKIAAKVDKVDQAYFDETIRPLMRDPLIEYVGEINDSQKQAFLAGATALLFPIDWPEPFGLVQIEAMACGTPVIAWRRGSVPGGGRARGDRLHRRRHRRRGRRGRQGRLAQPRSGTPPFRGAVFHRARGPRLRSRLPVPACRTNRAALAGEAIRRRSCGWPRADARADAPTAVLSRRGARSGDDIAVTGSDLGDHATREASKGAPSSTPYYIRATYSILERRPRTLKHGDTFGVFDHYGDVASGAGSPEGLFHKDTRYVSDLRVLLNGHRPLLLSSTVQDNNAILKADLANPDLFLDGRLELPRDVIHVVRSKFLWDGACFERLGVRSFDRATRRIEIAFGFGADFVDIFELRGQPRERRGEIRTKTSVDGVTFSYFGLDGVVRRCLIRFDPAPAEVDHRSARFALTIRPHERVSLFMAVSCEEDQPEPRPARLFFVGLRNAQRALRAATKRAASVESSNELFNEMLCRAVADLYMLTTVTEYGLFPYAGIPWFSTPFGRDAIITAIEMLWIDPTIARGVLRFLAATRRRNRSRTPTPNREKYCTRCARRNGAPRRSAVRPLLRRRRQHAACLFCWLGLYFERTRRPRDGFARCGRISKRRCSWIDTLRRSGRRRIRRIPRGRPRPDSSIRAGRIPPMRSFTRRRQARRRRDRALRGAGLCLRREAHWRRSLPRRVGPSTERAAELRREAENAAATTSRRRSGAMTSRTYALALDGAKATVPGASRRTPDKCCSPASRRTIALRRSPISSWVPPCSAAGEYGRSLRRRRATTRCRTTTARSGRTTTP